MTTLKREYYPLPLAASIIGCTTDDLIHWAANGRIRLGVLFTIDWAFPDYYTCFSNDIDHPIATPDFQGFAYVIATSFLSMEQRGGDLEFNEVRTLDNIVIHNSPGRFEGYYGSDFRSIDGIYIHRNDLLPLIHKSVDVVEETQPTDSGRAHVSNSLSILNQAATKFWANADKNDRSTHPKKSDVVAWLVEHGFSQITAESGSTIIRPEWAPTGRIAQQ